MTGLRNKSLVAIVGGVAVLLVLGLAAYSFISPKAETPIATDAAAVVALVERHIVVNRQEQPTVATVKDANLLRQQNPVFYRDAQDGDRLLVWSDKAVLYSPDRDVLIAVLPLQAASSSVVVTQERPTVEVRNGTTRAGLAKTLAGRLPSGEWQVLPPSDAKRRGSYPTTIIVDTAAFPKSEQALLRLTKGEIVPVLPSGEASSTADILVIIGEDFE